MIRRELILYYDEGWRAGWLLQRGRKWTRIRRILPELPEGSERLGKRRENIRVPTADTKAVEK